MSASARPNRAPGSLIRVQRGAGRLSAAALGCALSLSLVPGANACAACFGRSDSRLAIAMNWGIFSLMLVIVGVLAGIACCAVSLARKAAAHAAAEAEAEARARAEAVEPVEMELENS